MNLSRQEVNLRRILIKCELMVKNNQKDDDRLQKYVLSLCEMLEHFKETFNVENISDYTRRINNIKRIITDKNDNHNKVNISSRAELFEKENILKKRNVKDNDDYNELIDYHQNVQEKIAEDMIILTRNLKEQSMIANKIIKQDTEVLTKSSGVTENNFSKLKHESNKLSEHSKRACKCWMWIILIVVIVLFINMALFMKVMKKKN